MRSNTEKYVFAKNLWRMNEKYICTVGIHLPAPSDNGNKPRAPKRRRGTFPVGDTCQWPQGMQESSFWHSGVLWKYQWMSMWVSVRPWMLWDRGSAHSLKTLLDVKVDVKRRTAAHYVKLFPLTSTNSSCDGSFQAGSAGGRGAHAAQSLLTLGKPALNAIGAFTLTCPTSVYQGCGWHLWDGW